jgi:YYY domain-containing protein
MHLSSDDVRGFLRRRREPLGLAAILLVALALRVYHTDWDQGHLYHPDERFILMTTAAIQLSWPLTVGQIVGPHRTLLPPDFSYSYGTFAFFLLRLVAAIFTWLGNLIPPLGFLAWNGDLTKLALLARPISALFDVGSVYLIYRIGKQLFGTPTAFLAAGFVTFSVLDVQLSHFYATDTVMTALGIAAIAASLDYLQGGKESSAGWAGVFTGLALATKASAAPILAPVVAAFVLRLIVIEGPERRWQWRWPTSAALGREFTVLCWAGITAAAAFLIAEPYAILDPQHYLQGILDQGAMARGTADLPYTRQYFGRPAYLYFLQNLVLFGEGVPLGLAMIGGWLYLICRNVRRPAVGEVLLLIYVVPYFAITGDFYAKFMRYLLPIAPLLALFAAAWLVRLAQATRGWWAAAPRSPAPAVAGAAPALLRLPSEVHLETAMEAGELAELARFDGTGIAEPGDAAAALGANGYHGDAANRTGGPTEVGGNGPAPGDEAREVGSPASPVASGPATALPPVVDAETQRWLVRKGLDFGLLPAAGPSLAVDEAAEARAIEVEYRRFAELKGLSLTWPEEDEAAPESADAPETAPDGTAKANGTGSRTNGAGPDEWVEVPWTADAAEPETPDDRPPGWLIRRPRLAAFAASRWPSRLAGAAIAVVLGFSAFYTLAFLHMYDAPSPPVVASEWLYQHAPRGSVLATEAWDEGMPVPLSTPHGFEDGSTAGFQNVTMPMYDDDTQAKLDTIVNNLEVTDYLVFFSNRLYGTVPRLPNRYPMSRRYYEALFGGKLGFQLVEVASRYPNLLGVAFVDNTLADPGLPRPPLLQHRYIAPITINLGHADESFSVYDHQKVLVFAKTRQLTPDQLRAIIGPPPPPNTVSTFQSPPVYKTLVFTPAQEAIVQAGGTFRNLFDRNDFFNQYPLLVWIVLSALVGLAGLPLGFLVFRFLPDRGYLAAKTLGVLLLAWLSWIVVSVGLVQATRAEALGILVLYLILSGAAAYAQRSALFAFLRARRRLLLLEEALFWVAFFYDAYLRSLDPDLWHPVLGGEKPMDLAYLTAAIRSPIYPPYDPWFAGGYMNYYYFGQLIAGTLTKLSGILPTTAYNLIVPLWFALTVGGAFTAALALIHRGRGAPARPALLGGLLASLMVCVLGNLGGFLQLFTQVSQASPAHLAQQVPGLGALGDFVVGAVALLTGAQPFSLPQDWYWSSTRMLALLNLPGTGSINEFPYFTFLFADLHAHLLALPITLLAIALCINVAKSGGALAHLPELSLGSGRLGFSALAPPLTTDAPVPGEPSGSAVGTSAWTISTIASLLAAGLVLGALYPTNTWDYPTYVGLMALSLALPWYLDRRRTVAGFATLAGRFVVIVLLTQLLFRPFYAYFQSFYSGVHLIDEKSAISWYFAINGLFLVVMLSYFLLEGWERVRRDGLMRSLSLYLRKWDSLPRALELRERLVRPNPEPSWGLYGVVALALVVAGCVALGMSLTGALLVLLVIALAFLLRRDQSPEEAMVMLLFATGLAISVGTEQVALDGDIGRMNTIFKFYEQVWVLYGIASAVALVRIVRRLGTLQRPAVRWSWLAVIALFFLMAAVYPVLGTISRVSNRFDASLAPTLDGTAYMAHAVYVDDGHPLQLGTDLPAMIWLEDHVNGTPTILEGNRPIYRWGSRFSIYTGLPTVIGWDWHQKQQRWGYQDQVDQRLGAVAQMYDSPYPDLTRSLLHQYDVTYIIDGGLEQAFYPQARNKFNSMVGKGLTVVYDRDGVIIYEVQ